MTESAVVRRRAEREAKLARARGFAATLAERLPGLVGVVVVGSVARGDFNLWSDLDVLVVADDLPERWLDRSRAVAPVPPGTEAICWTPDELAHRRARRDAIAIEADVDGVTLWGELPR